MSLENMSVCILGRLPGLSLAELESLYGSSFVEKLSSTAALVKKTPDQIDFDRLGGTIKLTKVIHVFDTTDWNVISDYLVNQIPNHINNDKKLTLGLSTYGVNISPNKLLATGLNIKKALKKLSVSTRIVPNNTAALSSAQVFHNKLYSDNAWELCLVKSGNKVYLCKTTKVQDIDAYSARDQKRLKRDARVGMLPPKLAQTMINLAVGEQAKSAQVILDPFCGTGVILQEAMMMGYTAMGSDIEPRMGEYTTQNIDWLWQTFPQTQKVGRSWQLGDATNTVWKTSKFTKVDGEVTDAVRVPAKFDAIASEAYLGRPFSSLPDKKTLDKIIQDVDTISAKFLKNVASQTSPGFRMCIALPAWNNGDKFIRLPVVDSLEKLGYTRVSFKHASNSEMIYYRDDQVVARELLVLTRK